MAENEKRKSPSWIRFSGVGVEFAAAVAGLAFFGFWIDLKFQSKPWGLIIGTALGLIGGTYNLIRQTKSAFAPPESAKKKSDKDVRPPTP